MKPTSYFDIIEAFEKPGCAICRLLQNDADRFLDTLLYEFVVDPDVQNAFRASRGLCNTHGWQLSHQRGGNVGIAVLYQGAIDEALVALTQSPQKKGSSQMMRLFGLQADAEGTLAADRLAPEGRCMCCAALDAAEKRYIHTLATSLGDGRVRHAYASSDGLCLPHVRRLLQEAQDVQFIVQTQASIWKHLIAELELFRAKIDPRNTLGEMGDEGNSWLRAIEAMGGGSGVFGTDRRE